MTLFLLDSPFKEHYALDIEQFVCLNASHECLMMDTAQPGEYSNLLFTQYAWETH